MKTVTVLFVLLALMLAQVAMASAQEPVKTSFPGQITRVSVHEKTIRIEGEIKTAADDLFLAEIPIYADGVEQAQAILPLKPGNFHLQVDRFQGPRDRLLSRWVIVSKADGLLRPLSAAHYADEVAARAHLPLEKPRNKKGLGGFHLNSVTSDLEDLGISAVTVNVFLNQFMRSKPEPGTTAFQYDGRTWYVDDKAVAEMDRVFLAAAKRHIVVSAIILLKGDTNSVDSWAHLAAHPEASPSAFFAMPDVTSAAGVNAYGAALNFLAERYSRPDGQYGRIHNWILHNEVNSGWVWTNAGEKSPPDYLNLCQKSLRMAHLIARQYDPHARVFISLDHHWNANETAHGYRGRELLEILLRDSQTEGDFDWGIAFHPYPQDLNNPRVWEDDQVTFSFDTPKITLKNIEVLDAWARQPATFFRGKTPRVIHLTEQGFNSRDYSEKSLAEQAAGMAYAWHKYAPLPTIEVFDYHNWIDNRAEFGLRIGLRKFPDDSDDPLGRKPIWHVYQALGTTNQDQATAFAKPIIGITNWSEVPYQGKIR